jgi:protoheme ferro-lyase
VLAGLAGQGCGRAVIVPMYVGAGDFTDGITRIAADDALARDRRWSRGQLEWCGLSDEPDTAGRLAEILAGHCLAELRRRSVPLPSREWALLLAAHGTVVNPPAGVDNGLAQFERVLLPLRGLLKPHFGEVGVGWLNHTRGGRWTTPPVSEALAGLVKAGFSKLAYFPWGFTTDNAETLLEGRVALRGVQGSLERVEHLPCLNDRTEFISFLADRVGVHLDAPPGIIERARAAAAV